MNPSTPCGDFFNGPPVRILSAELRSSAGEKGQAAQYFLVRWPETRHPKFRGGYHHGFGGGVAEITGST